MTTDFSPQEMLDRAHIAIARVITAFSGIETALFTLFREYIGLEDSVARAVVGEPRFFEVTEALKRLAIVKKMDTEINAFLTEVLSRVANVKKIRNLVAHIPLYLQQEDGNDLVFCEQGTAKSTTSNHFIVYTIDELDLVYQEAQRLEAFIKYVHYKLNYPEMQVPPMEFRAALLEKPNMPTFPNQRRHPQRSSKQCASPGEGR